MIKTMKNALILDLDGTLVNNWVPLEGSVELIEYINENNISYFIVTNRVSKTVGQIGENLRFAGLNILNDHIINPIVALNKFIMDHGIKTFYFVGPKFQEEMIVKSECFDTFPEYVILCDFENIDCNYSLLNRIYQYLKNGSKMIATSYSNFYASGIEHKMDTGIFVKMYELLTGEKAKIIGKPSTEILEMALAVIKKEANEIIIIGDDGYSDIEGGKQLGMKTVLVKTGIYKDGDEEKYKPNYSINNLKEIDKVINI
jgi:HAD superfamily hydrolase (TIGR01450 family)